MDGFLKKILILFLLLCNYSLCFAEHVLPEFAGFWDIDFGKYIIKEEYNACGELVRVYGMQVTDLISYFKSHLPTPPSDCFYTGEPYIRQYFDQDTTRKCTYFQGTDEDWKIIMSKMQDSRMFFAEWSIDCESFTTHEKNSVVLGYTKPVYRCPTNSRFSKTLGYDNPYQECSSTPVPCIADVVARDIDNWMLKKFGHIGLMEEHTRVLNFLKKDGDSKFPVPEDGVYTHTLQEFMGRTKYWGERYGLLQIDNPYHDLEEDGAFRIAKRAEEQIGLPQEYTFSNFSSHSAGGGLLYYVDPDTHELTVAYSFIPGLFRCDSFVDYAYHTRVRIFPFNTRYTPRSMFYTFLNPRYLQFPPSKYVNTNFPNEVSHIFIGALPAASKEEIIKNLFNEPQPALDEIDEAVFSYLADRDFARDQQKMSFLWELACTHEDDEYKYGYITDVLSLLAPIELADQIIDGYQKQTSLSNKIKSIRLCMDSFLYLRGWVDPQKITDAQKEDMLKIEGFLKSIINLNTPLPVFRHSSNPWLDQNLSFHQVYGFFPKPNIQYAPKKFK